MGIDIAGYLKTLLERLSFSIGLAACVASGFVVFLPLLQSNLDIQYRMIALIVFIFSLVWVVWEVVVWISKILKDQRKLAKAKRQRLYMDIFHMQKRFFGGFRGMLYYPANHYEAAAQIADKYARLNRLGIQTPEIDLAEDKWDFDAHNRFLTALMPFLNNSTLDDVKKNARIILAKDVGGADTS